MEKANLKDIIDVSFLDNFVTAFAQATKMAAMAFDMEKSITKPNNFTDFCMKYTRNSPEGLKRCLACDLKSGKESSKTGRPYVYHCHLGIVDFAVPIIVDGMQVGSVLGGQVLTSPPDERQFREAAIEFGIDPEKYLEALRKVNIVSEEQVNAAANLLYLSMGKISENWANVHKINECSSLITHNIKQISRSLDDFTQFILSLEKMQEDELDKTKSVLSEITKIAKNVSIITTRTQMISINISIEAARAGEAGRSFSVIAREIKDLAVLIKKMSDGILEFTTELSSAIETSKTDGDANSRDFLKSGLKDLHTINEELGKIQALLHTLNVLSGKTSSAYTV